VIYCCLCGDLQSGDYLIVDNAAVHGGADTWRVVTLVLRAYNVHLRYLPAYSPELNPCELVFNEVKRWVRAHREVGVSVFEEVLKAISTITQEQMFQWYLHCLFPRQVLPDLMSLGL